MSGDITWTEIAVQLTGEAPVSCKMTDEGGLKVTLAGGKVQRFTPQQVDDAIEDLDEIAKSQEGANQRFENQRFANQRFEKSQPEPAAESKPESKPAAEPKPTTADKPKSKSRTGKAKK